MIQPRMDTAKTSAFVAATTEDGQRHWRGVQFSLSWRERAGVRESAAKSYHSQQTQRRPVSRAVLPHPLSLSRWERENAGGCSLNSLPFLREIASLYYGFLKRREVSELAQLGFALVSDLWVNRFIHPCPSVFICG